MMRDAVRLAARGSLAAMKAISSSRLRRAVRSHLICIRTPLVASCFHFGRVCEFAILGFGQCALDFPDLPFVQGDVFANGFCGQKGSASVGGSGQGVQASLGVFLRADGHCSGHGVFLLHTYVYKLAHGGAQ